MSTTQAQDVTGNTVRGNQTIINAAGDVSISGSGSERADEDKLNTSCPYPGLRAYEFHERERFFGREALLDRYLPALEQHRFLAVRGPPGSGKSSLVRAGVAPSWIKRAPNKRKAVLVELDRNPFLRLMTALASMRSASGRVVLRSSELEFCARPSTEALAGVAKLAGARNERWLIVLDRLEELLVDDEGAEGRAWFLREVEKLAAKPCEELQLVVTLTEKDFITNELAKRAPSLAPRFVSLPKLDPQALEDAIRRPAALHGVTVNSGLVARLIKPLVSRAEHAPHGLPYLQYALRQIWQNELEKTRDKGLLDGLDDDSFRPGALVGLRLQEAGLREFDLEDNVRVARLLVTPNNDAGKDGAYKPAPPRPRARFHGDKEHRVLDRLIERRLVAEAAGRVWIEDCAELDLMLTRWGVREELKRERANDDLLRDELEEYARRWRAALAPGAKPGPHELWLDWRLEYATSDATRSKLESLRPYTEEERAFLDASAHERGRKTRKLRRRLIFALVALALAIVAALASNRYRLQAEAERARAEKARKQEVRWREDADKATARAEREREAARRSARDEKASREKAEQLVTFLLDEIRDALTRRGGLDLLKVIDDRIERYYTDDRHRNTLNHFAALRIRSERLLSEGRYQSAGALLIASEALQSALTAEKRQSCEFRVERVRTSVAQKRLLADLGQYETPLRPDPVALLDQLPDDCAEQSTREQRDLLRAHALVLRARLATPVGNITAPPSPAVLRDLEQAEALARGHVGETRSRADELLWTVLRYRAELHETRLYKRESLLHATAQWHASLRLTDGEEDSHDLTWRWRRAQSLAGLARLLERVADAPRDCRELTIEGLRPGRCAALAATLRRESLAVIQGLVAENPKDIRWRTDLARVQLQLARNGRDPIERRQLARAAYETIDKIIKSNTELELAPGAADDGAIPQVTGHQLILLLEASTGLVASEERKAKYTRAQRAARDNDEQLAAKVSSFNLSTDSLGSGGP